MTTTEPIPSTLYHYCSAEAFLQIIGAKSIRLSSVLGFNDYLETRWIEPMIEAVIKEKTTGKDAAFFNAVYEHYNANQTVPFMTCFSSDGDTLSQWRAYAADGMGFAIGFNPQYFPLRRESPWINEEQEHAIGISEVVYNRAAQHSHIRQTLDDHLAQCCLDDTKSISHHAAECATMLLRYSLISKNPKFVEELEWRIIYVPALTGDEGEPIRIGLKQRPISALQFRYSDDAIIPYFELSFAEPRVQPAINEVVLGPKNNTHPFVARMLLEVNGLEEVKVAKSEASYR